MNYFDITQLTKILHQQCKMKCTQMQDETHNAKNASP